MLSLTPLAQEPGYYLELANINYYAEGGEPLPIWHDMREGLILLVYHTKRLAFSQEFRQACTDSIRFSHGASSGTKVYRTAFIPDLHDVCTVFEKPS